MAAVEIHAISSARDRSRWPSPKTTSIWPPPIRSGAGSLRGAAAAGDEHAATASNSATASERRAIPLASAESRRALPRRTAAHACPRAGRVTPGARGRTTRARLSMRPVLSRSARSGERLDQVGHRAPAVEQLAQLDEALDLESLGADPPGPRRAQPQRRVLRDPALDERRRTAPSRPRRGSRTR